MLSRKREIELSELAETIAELYCPSEIVLPEHIATMKGITFSNGDYGSAFDGLIEFENGSFHIFVNTKLDGDLRQARPRFTFAHELGHYFIDEHRQALLNGRTPSHPSYTNFASKNPIEIEADHFAASLLLPASRVKKDCVKRSFNFSLVQDISQKYGASITATVLRLMTIDKHPIMLVCSVQGKVKWFKHSHDFPFKWLKQPFGYVPKYTLAGTYFKNGEKFAEELPISANEWFEYVSDRDLSRNFWDYRINCVNF
ncbi:ImmA/IrrE family metallo-endopeptidase [Dyadobacter sediminis]|uniref:ImmA/IrrE family metallo-endopeptidase n=1 Tax=Dyadobacter sediminis TaxID=1493691 RepID=A0A5R9K5N5_9BACT|nr:ImmA/IrrE family metallo-endopeptidase [Dyadobacter sediminis]TLU88975.1 ImmA/IrrE family metallo-endopeptidase [Dyadobacter sediminis]GGC15850.1 hypothetical protein GCM10011325_48320 [Dyadobacter sediminis]